MKITKLDDNSEAIELSLGGSSKNMLQYFGGRDHAKLRVQKVNELKEIIVQNNYLSDSL